MKDVFQVEFAPEDDDTPENKEKLIELPATTVEKILQGDEEMLNIARNLANKGDPKINPADYIDKVKEELIKSGKLGKDNYIDEQKRADCNERMMKILLLQKKTLPEVKTTNLTNHRRWQQIIRVLPESITIFQAGHIPIFQFQFINARDQEKLYCQLR